MHLGRRLKSPKGLHSIKLGDIARKSRHFKRRLCIKRREHANQASRILFLAFSSPRMLRIIPCFRGFRPVSSPIKRQTYGYIYIRDLGSRYVVRIEKIHPYMLARYLERERGKEALYRHESDRLLKMHRGFTASDR